MDASLTRLLQCLLKKAIRNAQKSQKSIDEASAEQPQTPATKKRGRPRKTATAEEVPRAPTQQQQKERSKFAPKAETDVVADAAADGKDKPAPKAKTDTVADATTDDEVASVAAHLPDPFLT